MPNDLELELAIRDFYVRNGEKMLRDLVIVLGRDNMREENPTVAALADRLVEELRGSQAMTKPQ